MRRSGTLLRTGFPPFFPNMKKLLLVTSAFERDHLFPDGLSSWINSIGHECRLVEASDVQGFARTLTEYGPQVVIGGWDMPPLPLPALRAQGGSVDYLCFLCGSPKKQIGEEHLRAGLVLTNWGPWVGPYVAEGALLLVLSALRRVAKWGYQLRENGQWRERTTHNRSLYGKRVGIHGFGGIPRALTKLMAPFNPIIATWDPFVSDEVLAAHGVKRAASVEALYAGSDVLVNLLPLTAETERCVTEQLLRLLPEGACFVNNGRGQTVDEEALIKVAREGRIEVALDVYAREPLAKDSPLRTLPNVFLLPHMGGATIDRGRDCGQRALQNVERYLTGQALENRVDLPTFVRMT